jgi:hypothetical protein
MMLRIGAARRRTSVGIASVAVTGCAPRVLEQVDCLVLVGVVKMLVAEPPWTLPAPRSSPRRPLTEDIGDPQL